MYVNVCKYSPDQPAELGFGLNVPDTISPRLDEEFPLDLLLQWHIKQKVFSEWCFKRLLVKTVFLLLFVVHGVKSLGTKLRKAKMENSALARTHAPLWAWHLHASSPPIHQLPGSSLVHLFKVNPFFSRRIRERSFCRLLLERPFAARPSSLTHPWKRPLFCSCWSRMFSSFSGLGMKPMSQPSFTRRPIHQSLLNFYGLWETWIDQIFMLNVDKKHVA